MLEWLESSYIARMVQESAWGYPIVLSAHAVGMAILAGIVLMINFRVLGLAPRVPLSALKSIYKVALIGLVINAISGTMLFVANPDAFVQSTPFWLKMGNLVIGITLLLVMAKRLFPSPGIVEGAAPGSNIRTLAWISSIAWFGVIVMGRLIAYWDWKDF